jgi:phosphoheptose isomerase
MAGANSLFAQGMVLPFKYAEGPMTLINQAGSVVYPGVMNSAVNGQLQVVPTETLFVAPKKAKTQLAGIVQAPGSNCQAFNNDKAVETTLSEVYKSKVDTLASDQDFLVQIQTEEKAQNLLCLDAMKSSNPKKLEICALAKEYRQMRLDTMAENILPQIKDLNDVREMVSMRIADYGNQYGGYAGAIVSLFDQKELDDVQAANPGKNIRVVPVKKIIFSFNAGIEAAAALGDDIPRKTALGYYLQGESVTTKHEGGTPQAVTRLKAGQSVSLGINLSVIGACASADLRTANFDYSYDTFAYVKGQVVYNKSDYYYRLQKKTTKGGFFTSSSSVKVTEESEQAQTLSVTAIGSDEVVKKEMKDHMLKLLEDKLLASVARKEVAAVDAPGSAPQNGATTAGQALTEKCPDYRCQIAGYTLLALSDIFGKGTTSGEVEAKFKETITEDWSETTVFEADDGASSAAIIFKPL